MPKIPDELLNHKNSSVVPFIDTDYNLFDNKKLLDSIENRKYSIINLVEEIFFKNNRHMNIYMESEYSFYAMIVNEDNSWVCIQKHKPLSTIYDNIVLTLQSLYSKYHGYTYDSQITYYLEIMFNEEEMIHKNICRLLCENMERVKSNYIDNK